MILVGGLHSDHTEIFRWNRQLEVGRSLIGFHYSLGVIWQTKDNGTGWKRRQGRQASLQRLLAWLTWEEELCSVTGLTAHFQAHDQAAAGGSPTP